MASRDVGVCRKFANLQPVSRILVWAWAMAAAPSMFAAPGWSRWGGLVRVWLSRRLLVTRPRARKCAESMG